MVRAYHLIISAYGFWLPNDERGSWSSFVRSYELYRAGGAATKVDTRRSVASRPADPQRRAAARQALAHEPVRFRGEQALAIAAGFADYVRRVGCAVHACAIMPDHAHLVIARHRVLIERTCDQFKAAATAELSRRGLHPFTEQPYRGGRLPTPWARKGWWVYLNDETDVQRAVRYVEQNPVRAGLRPQRWSFVTRA